MWLEQRTVRCRGGACSGVEHSKAAAPSPPTHTLTQGHLGDTIPDMDVGEEGLLGKISVTIHGEEEGLEKQELSGRRCRERRAKFF